MEFNYSYQKKRSEFGRQCMFNDRGPELIDNYAANRKFLKEYIYRDPVDEAIQNVTVQAEHELNTYRAEYANAGINHIEGGWPKDVNINDEEQTKRYRRKIEKDEGYPHIMSQLCKNMEECILQNNAINIYQQYYTDVEPTPLVEPSTARTVNVFSDQLAGNPRPITHISWYPEDCSKLVITHCNMVFHAKIPPGGTCSYIWELENPNMPQLILQPPDQSVCIEYNPRDPNTLASGQFNGQVAIWDVRTSNEPVDFTLMEESHRDPITDLIWTHSKTGTEFFTGSTDGMVKWWDTRKLNASLESLIVDMTKDEQILSRAMGCSVLEYEPTIPTRFMIGTETGHVIGGNKKGKLPQEKMIAKYQAHLGPVLALERNPAFVKNFLTVGDWTAKIWSEDCKESPIMWTCYHQARLLAATWSPTRFSVFFTCRSDGIIDVWDVLQNQEHATLSIKVCDVPLTSVRANELGRLTAVGSQKGTAYVVEMCEHLSYSAKNDKALLTAMFERENRREKILEARNRELRLKQKVGGSAILGTSRMMLDKYSDETDFFDDIYIKSAEIDFYAYVDKMTKKDEPDEEEEEEIVEDYDAAKD
ncbi:dynein intermediate chain 3, ciliary isoform X2 [Atheta coriaria]|uniref:dynein intermediate chain 3, ciliary isoform X2 n=1 Tax=Dalotia coriaria TaxID=877792 RepID=UPI0031F444C2